MCDATICDFGSNRQKISKKVTGHVFVKCPVTIIDNMVPINVILKAFESYILYPIVNNLCFFHG
jgi:hypothetical protein